MSLAEEIREITREITVFLQRKGQTSGDDDSTENALERVRELSG
jgi:hypothetical protein